MHSLLYSRESIPLVPPSNCTCGRVLHEHGNVRGNVHASRLAQIVSDRHGQSLPRHVLLLLSDSLQLHAELVRHGDLLDLTRKSEGSELHLAEVAARALFPHTRPLDNAPREFIFLEVVGGCRR